MSGQHQPPGVAARVGQAQQLQIGDHILIVGGNAPELFEEVERDVGLPFGDRLLNDLEFVPQPQSQHFMVQLPQRCEHIVLGPPLDLGRIRPARIVRWNQILVHQD